MKEEYLFDDLSKAVSNYPEPQMALVPFLKIINEQNKSIEPEDVKELARLCKVKAENIIKIIDYYSYFDNLKKPTATICIGLPCYLKGSNKIAEKPEEYLDTSNSVEFTNCLGNCHEAPVIRLEDGTLCSPVIEA